MLSNHHPSPFTLKGNRYANIEHYLAHQWAILSEDAQIIQNAIEAEDPLVAKSILNHLKKDHAKEWGEKVENILMQGLRQKFKQNDALLNYLKNTQQLELGEASRDPKWGIGMSLDDPDVLDTAKWATTGNLLGRALTKIRQEFLKATSASPHRQPPNSRDQRHNGSTTDKDSSSSAPTTPKPREKVSTENKSVQDKETQGTENKKTKKNLQSNTAEKSPPDAAPTHKEKRTMTDDKEKNAADKRSPTDKTKEKVTSQTSTHKEKRK